MGRRVRTLVMAGLGLAALAGLVAPPVGVAAIKVIDRIVATVDGAPITQYELDLFVRRTAGRGDSSMLKPDDWQKVLDVLITETLIRSESSRLGLIVTPDDVENYINQIRQQNNLEEAELAAALKEQGLSLDAYRRQIRTELLKQQLIGRQIRQRVNVPEEEVRRFYEDHLDDFAEPAAVVVRHILFLFPQEATPEAVASLTSRAQEAQRRLADGEAFASVARDLSDAPDREDGGLIGKMKKGEMLPELENVAFRMRVGMPSPPVQSRVGLHILQVDEREASSHVAFETVENQIRERLYAEAIESRFQDWIDSDLRAGHDIVVRR